MVPDVQNQSIVLPAYARHFDRVPRAELDRVGEQVESDLPNFAGVGDHRPGRLARVEAQLHRVRLREGGDGDEKIPDEHGELDGLELQLQLSRLDLREVENVVDELQQVRPGEIRPADAGNLLLVQRTVDVVEKKGRVPENRVDRGAQLVAH